MLSQNAKLGQVLFYFQKKNSKKPNCDIGLNYYNPDSVMVYESEKGLSGTNDSKETWFVWATVNDMIIKDFEKESNRQAYLGGASNDTLKRKNVQWEILRQQNYNRIWFDDNFGSFVVSAKILKPSGFFSW